MQPATPEVIPDSVSPDSVSPEFVFPKNFIPTTIVGIDVSKAKLDVAFGPMQLLPEEVRDKSKHQVQQIVNRRRNVVDFLQSLPSGSALMVESTGRYHQLVCDLAFAHHIPVYLLNPYRVSSYRRQDGQRAKTDTCDALLLVRFGREKFHELRRYVPLTPDVKKLQSLIRLRSMVVRSQTAVKLGMEEVLQLSALAGPLATIHTQALALCTEYANTIELLEEEIKVLLTSSPTLKPLFDKLLEIPGIGLVTASSLLCALHRGEFETAESFVAFLGLDPVAQDSGQTKGRRRISKKGDPQVRTALFMAATACNRSRHWKVWIARYKSRGFKHPQIACIVARRLATIAWCLIKKNLNFSLERMFSPPGSTISAA